MILSISLFKHYLPAVDSDIARSTIIRTVPRACDMAAIPGVELLPSLSRTTMIGSSWLPVRLQEYNANSLATNEPGNEERLLAGAALY